MSKSELELQVAKLKEENEQLKNQMEQNTKGVQNLLAQIESYKITFNESLQGVVNLRTGLILAQNQLKECQARLKHYEEKAAEDSKPKEK